MKSLPGPQVGSEDNEHTIFPPVSFKADNAELRAGSRTGSSFFIRVNSSGSRERREVMTSLGNQQKIMSCLPPRLTLIRRGSQRDRRYPAVQKGPLYPT